jgi:hypothetical protein
MAIIKAKGLKKTHKAVKVYRLHKPSYYIIKEK